MSILSLKFHVSVKHHFWQQKLSTRFLISRFLMSQFIIIKISYLSQGEVFFYEKGCCRCCDSYCEWYRNEKLIKGKEFFFGRYSWCHFEWETSDINQVKAAKTFQCEIISLSTRKWKMKSALWFLWNLRSVPGDGNFRGLLNTFQWLILL